MSLSTRIAIGPSRRLAFAEAAMIAGAIAVTAATVAARLVAESAPAAVWLVTGLATLSAVGICVKRRIKPIGPHGHEVFIGDRGTLSVRCPGEDTKPHAFALTDASLVWPGFAVLSLSPSPSPSPPLAPAPASMLPAWARLRTFDLAVVRAEMDADDGRRLYRYLLWAQRNGSHRSGSDPGGATSRGSLV